MEEIKKKQDSLGAFNEGINHYVNSSFDTAAKVFQSITELHPGDETAAFFLEAAKRSLQPGSAQKGKGIVEMMNK
jgi:hypothetical protein